MDAHSTRKSNYPLWLGFGLVALFASVLTAEAKCTIRSGDPLIKARYQGCNPRSFISYLYNDLITPYSFTCAKQLKATCQNEKCEHPATEAEARRCLDRFAEVLTSCSKQIDDAARMAKCTDTKAWPVDQILAQFMAAMPKTKVATTAPMMTLPSTAPMVIQAEKRPAQASVSANSLPRSNGPMTDAEKAEMAAAASADAEATATREAPSVPTTVTSTTAPTTAETLTSPATAAAAPAPISTLDTTSPPATPTVVGETSERAPAAVPGTSTAETTTPVTPSTPANVASPTNLAPATTPALPSVKAEPLPGEAFRVARKPARTSRAPRTRYPARN